MLEAADILNIPPPQLYIKQNPQPNAFTLAISVGGQAHHSAANSTTVFVFTHRGFRPSFLDILSWTASYNLC